METLKGVKTMSINWAEIALVFVYAAEKYITGTKKGAERKEWVMNKIYEVLPDIITKLLPREMLDGLIENAVAQMKEQLAQQAEE